MNEKARRALLRTGITEEADSGCAAEFGESPRNKCDVRFKSSCFGQLLFVTDTLKRK